MELSKVHQTTNQNSNKSTVVGLSRIQIISICKLGLCCGSNFSLVSLLFPLSLGMVLYDNETKARKLTFKLGWFSNRMGSELVMACANQTTDLTNGTAANWAPDDTIILVPSTGFLTGNWYSRSVAKLAHWKLLTTNGLDIIIVSWLVLFCIPNWTQNTTEISV